MNTANALYESWHDGKSEWCEIELPENRITSEGVASYLRFGGRISDGTLKSFIWEDTTYDSMGRELSTPERIND